MKKLKIITAFDKDYEIGFLAMSNHMLYAYAHGYSYERYEVTNFDRPPAWYKVKALLTELEKNEHELVMWVDADAFFADFGFDFVNELGNHLDPGRSLFLRSHYVTEIPTGTDFVNLTRSRLNTGVMVVRNTTHAKELLQAVWEKTEYMHHDWWEQAALMDILGYKFELTGKSEDNKRSERFFPHVGALPPYMNCIPEAHHMISTEAMAPVILHLAGFSNRLELARFMVKGLQMRIVHRRLTDYSIDLY